MDGDRPGSGVWRNGKVVQTSRHLTVRKTPRSLPPIPPHAAAAAATIGSSSSDPSGASPRKIKEVSARLLAPTPVEHVEESSPRKRCTQEHQEHINEQLYYGPVKHIATQLQDLQKKYMASTLSKPRHSEDYVSDEDIAARMYKASMEHHKATREALFKKYVGCDSEEALRRKLAASSPRKRDEGKDAATAALVERLYTASVQKHEEEYQKALSKHVPQRKFRQMTKEEIDESAARLTVKK